MRSLIICTHHPILLGDKIEKNEMEGACSGYGGGETRVRVLVRKSEGKGPLGRPRRRWKDNIKMYLQEVGCGGADWIELAQTMYSWRALVNAVMTFRFHKMQGFS